MGWFNSTIAAALQCRTVRFGYLVELQVLPKTIYFWNGNGSLVTGGHTWLGLAQLGQIEGLEESLNGQSAPMRVTLSGASITGKLLKLATQENQAAYVGKLLRIWLQFFDADWALLDNPYALAAGIIDGISVSRSESGDSSIIRSLAVTAENIFFGRRIPPNGYYTDSDQQQRFPGDRGLEFIPSLQDRTISVPW